MKIKNFKLKIGLLIGLFVYLFICLLPPTAVASALSLSIDPPIIVINAIPPTNVTNILNIENKSDIEMTLQIQIKPFKAKGENGDLEYIEDSSQIYKNIRIMDNDTAVQNITLNPQQQKELNLNIDIPEDTEIGDRYFSIIFISKNSSAIESSHSLNQIGIATNVLLPIGAKETPKALLEKFSSNIFFQKGPVPFTVKIKNNGIHFIKPKGEIIIKNMFGQTIGKLDLISQNVLSNSIRAIPNKNWQESFLLGLYTATLNISMSDDGPTFIKSIHFLAFPLQILTIIVIIIIIAIMIKNRLKILNKNRT